MTENNGFCASCGKPIYPENTFCTGCGTAVPQQPTAPAPVAQQPAPEYAAPPVAAPPSSAEQIVSILAGITIASGFMGLKRKSYTMIMTNYRVILAELTSEMLKTAMEQARSETKADGGGFFKQWGAQIGASFAYAEQYAQMTPDAALAQNPENFAWDRGAIEKIKLHAGMTRNEGADDPDYITVKVAGEKFKLLLTGGTLAHSKEALIKAGLI